MVQWTIFSCALETRKAQEQYGLFFHGLEIKKANQFPDGSF